MKKLFLFMILAAMGLHIMQAQKSGKPTKSVETVIFTVNMDCQDCVNKLTKQLAFEKGVKDLYLNLNDQVVAIKYRADKTTKELLKKSIEKLEYQVAERQSREGLPEGWKI
jgi:periplasmic mercuric ion binding protein